MNFHNYVINIDNFGLKLVRDQHHLVPLPGPESMFFVLWNLNILLKG
jgi:hypothetical protein